MKILLEACVGRRLEQNDGACRAPLSAQPPLPASAIYAKPDADGLVVISLQMIKIPSDQLHEFSNSSIRDAGNEIKCIGSVLACAKARRRRAGRRPWGLIRESWGGSY
ncbi:hypothetical protein [Paucibacter sp. B51]|uniref:hypothetical protein n=1 Tax=Paucibacter sp. B51 TaxID=2993315 RepID=UPI0022EBB23F|nr:hypothetical protein [Paucibacter sp. B51]